MSTLKTYDRPTNLDGWPFRRIDGCGDFKCDGELKPGDWVCPAHGRGKGMIVAINSEQISILWSEAPFEVDYSKFVAPLVRRVYTPLIAKDIISVQPMRAPSGSIFYHDYKYGEDKPLVESIFKVEQSLLDKRCNEGLLPVKLFWKACRWIRNVVTRAFTKKLKGASL